MSKVGYLGPEGTFSHQALRAYLNLSSSHDEPVPCPSFHQLVEGLLNGAFERIILPIENSTEGVVTAVSDLLVSTDNIHIVDAISYPINNYLMARTQLAISEITDIFSHPQPLAQCSAFLASACPKAQLHPTRSTADAVRSIQIAADPYAVIGSKELATIHGLQLLNSDSIGLQENRTVFGIIKRGAVDLNQFQEPRQNSVISIVFSTVKDKPGSLYMALGEFAARKINLSKIASRPTKNQLGEYLFYLDIDGDLSDMAIREVLEIVAEKSLYFKILGAYKVHHVRSNVN